jgi:hypothetical protein
MDWKEMGIGRRPGADHEGSACRLDPPGDPVAACRCIVARLHPPSPECIALHCIALHCISLQCNDATMQRHVLVTSSLGRYSGTSLCPRPPHAELVKKWGLAPAKPVKTSAFATLGRCLSPFFSVMSVDHFVTEPPNVTKCEVLIFQGLVEHFVKMSKCHTVRAAEILTSPGTKRHGDRANASSPD